jgi:O-antigen/teichoic acid export membrane protein
VTAVAIYQVASRSANVLLQFTHQFQENLTPIAAALYKDGQTMRLQRILFNSNRIIAVITTLLFIILTTLAKPILLIWLDISPANPQYASSYTDILKILYIMNVSIFLLLLFRSGSSKVLLMTGSHKFLSYVAIAESIMNVGFSIFFIKLIGVVGVAVGTLIPNIILGIFVIFPRAARFSGISVIKTLKKIYLPLFINCLPPLIFAVYILRTIPLLDWNLFTLAWVGAAMALIYLFFGWLLILSADERIMILSRLRNLQNK